MVKLLNDDQLMILMHNDPLFDRIAPLLNGPLQEALTAFQIRAGNTYDAGTWDVPATGETFTNPDCPQPPTWDESQALLLDVYSAIPQESPLRHSLRSLMTELGLPPAPTSAEARLTAKPSANQL